MSGRKRDSPRSSDYVLEIPCPTFFEAFPPVNTLLCATNHLLVQKSSFSTLNFCEAQSRTSKPDKETSGDGPGEQSPVEAVEFKA